MVGVGLARPGDTIVLASAGGQAIRFDEAAVRQMGRASTGVRGIKLRENDRVVGMLVAHDPEAFVLTACEHGHGKRTPLSDYPIKGRGGLGVINVKTGGRNGLVVGAKLCREADDLIFVTASGMLVRSPVADVSSMGRNTQGVMLVNLKEEDRLVSLEVVEAEDLEEYASTMAAVQAARPAAEGTPDDAAKDGDDEDDAEDAPEADDAGDSDEPDDAGEPRDPSNSGDDEA